MPKNPPKQATIRDVARRAGVSVATVSRVMNQNTPVSGPIADRVRDAMQALRYFPQAAARNLSNQQTHTIGFLLDDWQGDFAGQILQGISSCTAEEGYQLLIATPAARDSHSQFPLPLGPHNCDGLLIYASSLTEKTILALDELNFPMVILHGSAPQPTRIPSVVLENFQAAREAVSHLIEVHQCRRIVCLTGPQSEDDAGFREAGYRQALEKHQIAIDEHLIRRGDFNRQAAYQSMCALIQEGASFDAVFSGDDEAAVGVLQALRQYGLRCPQDIALVGFDDQRIADCLSPTLTTVHAPTERVGSTAARLLLQMLQGSPVTERIYLPTHLVVRQSCGCGAEI